MKNPPTVNNISRLCEEKFCGQASLQAKISNSVSEIDFITVRNETGDLFECLRSPAHNERLGRVSYITGKKISGPMTRWETFQAPDPDSEAHIASSDKNSDLIVFTWSPRNDWQFENVSEMFNHKPKIADSGITSIVIGNTSYLVVHGIKNNLLLFWYEFGTKWEFLDLTTRAAIASSKKNIGLIEGIPSIQVIKCNQEIIFYIIARGKDGILWLYKGKTKENWQIINLSQICDIEDAIIISDPYTWLIKEDKMLIMNVVTEVNSIKEHNPRLLLLSFSL